MVKFTTLLRKGYYTLSRVEHPTRTEYATHYTPIGKDDERTSGQYFQDFDDAMQSLDKRSGWQIKEEKPKTQYIQNGKFFFTDDTDPAFMQFVNRAYDNNSRVIVEYNEGWEDFSGYHGGNGLKHHIYIGRSTGTQPIALAIHKRTSIGGCGLMTCKKSIKRYYAK